MKTETRELLYDVQNQGQSEAMIVADGLLTIAENEEWDPEMGTDDHLIACADEIAGWAKYFIEQVKKSRKKDVKKEEQSDESSVHSPK